MNSSHRIKVLLIEDDPGDARLIREMLADARGDEFQLEHAGDLTRGLERLAAGGIDVILADLTLPDSQGLPTFARVRGQAKKIPIIVLSGLDDEKLALRAVQEGAQDYLVKGRVDGHLLSRALRYAIERKRTQDQLALYAAELRLKNAQMEADLCMAREIQEAFLPDQFPSFPPGVPNESSSLRFCHRYQPSGAVGGDFFHVQALSGTRAGVFICDAMGRGVRAALVTSMIRALVEEMKPMADDPGQFLARINRQILAILGQPSPAPLVPGTGESSGNKMILIPTFLTAFYLVADSASGEVQYANAGHPFPFLVRMETKEVMRLPAVEGMPGPPLGLKEGAVYPAGKAILSVKDLVILFTDGLFEVTNPSLQHFGEERLEQEIGKRISLPCQLLFSELLGEIERFANSKKFDDDICILGMELARLVE